ncbi:MAG: hypothetical protein IKO64_01055 [Kiritimatiellae bacterium]|nr:hypothetical protein [Kiritimatiellia bacterium]
MARPSIIQYLKHGKILAGKVFGSFVETWNWMVAGWANLKGDYDVDPENGLIYIDRTDEEHPVIRLRTDRLPATGANITTEDVDAITGLKLKINDGKLEILVQKTPLSVVAKGTPGSYAATQDTQLTLSTKEVVIKTDFEIAANRMTDNHYLGLKYKTAQLSVLGVGADSAATITKQNMRTISVVEKSEYDTTTHKFVNTSTEIDVPDFGESEGNDEIFEATPHSAESEPSQGAGE